VNYLDRNGEPLWEEEEYSEEEENLYKQMEFDYAELLAEERDA